MSVRLESLKLICKSLKGKKFWKRLTLHLRFDAGVLRPNETFLTFCLLKRGGKFSDKTCLVIIVLLEVVGTSSEEWRFFEPLVHVTGFFL